MTGSAIADASAAAWTCNLDVPHASLDRNFLTLLPTSKKLDCSSGACTCSFPSKTDKLGKFNISLPARSLMHAFALAESNGEACANHASRCRLEPKYVVLPK